MGEKSPFLFLVVRKRFLFVVCVHVCAYMGSCVYICVHGYVFTGYIYSYIFRRGNRDKKSNWILFSGADNVFSPSAGVRPHSQLKLGSLK